MDRVSIRAERPLQIRSGHTPVNLGLMCGSLFASIPAIITEGARSHSVDAVLPTWASYVFYGILLLGSAVSLGATWQQLPTELNPAAYRVIVSRLVRERIGHYAVAGTMLCFATSVITANGFNGLPGAAFLAGPAVGLLFRARQTHVDVNKLHDAMGSAEMPDAHVVADPTCES